MTDKAPKKKVEPTQPRDVVDGIPDRASKRSFWKYLLAAAIFLAWVAFLIYCLVAG